MMESQMNVSLTYASRQSLHWLAILTEVLALLKHVPDEVGEAVTAINSHDYSGAADWLARSKKWIEDAQKTSNDLTVFARFIRTS